jgi:hypothetical protein
MNWKLTQVHDSGSYSRLALATAPSGAIYMAIGDESQFQLVVAMSMDDGMTWTKTIVDQAGKTGLAASIAFDQMERPLVAYEYCGRAGESDCPMMVGAHSVIRLARLEGSDWKIYQVDDGQGMGHVGLFTSIVVTSDGKMGIAYVDDMNGSLLYAKEK